MVEQVMGGSITKFGITTYDYAAADLLDLARTAESLGFDSFWFGEHYVVPASHASNHPAADKENEKAILTPRTKLYDPWFLLGAIAGATRTIRLGTAICIVPLNNPLILARATATAYDVSSGRFLLGTGGGWLREEFDALGVPFEERGSRLDETIEILRKAWSGEVFRHDGKHFHFDPIHIVPHATPVPLICGGNSAPALRRVARAADGWINSAMIAPEDAVLLRARIEDMRKSYGTHQRPFSYFVRPTKATPEAVEPFVRAGFENIILWGPNVWPSSRDIGLDEKRAGLREIARSLGIQAVRT